MSRHVVECARPSDSQRRYVKVAPLQPSHWAAFGFFGIFKNQVCSGRLETCLYYPSQATNKNRSFWVTNEHANAAETFHRPEALPVRAKRLQATAA